MDEVYKKLKSVDVLFHVLFVAVHFLSYFFFLKYLNSSGSYTIKSFLGVIILTVIPIQFFTLLIIAPNKNVKNLDNLPKFIQNCLFLSFLLLFIFLSTCLLSWFLFLFSLQSNVEIFFTRYIHLFYLFAIFGSSFILKKFYILIHYGGIDFIQYITNGMGNPEDFHYEYESDYYNEEIYKKNKALKTLGLEENSTKDQIKKAYRELAKKFHPDISNDSEYFKKINLAYEYLTKSS